MAQKDKVKELVGRGLHSYHTKSLQQMDRIEKKNKEQNHKISILSNELDNDYLTKTEEGSVISLEHSKEGMVYLDELQGNTLVNYCTDGFKELTLNGDIDVEGTFVTTTEGVDNGLVDVACEGNTLVNLNKRFNSTQTPSWDATNSDYVVSVEGQTVAGGVLWYYTYLKPSTTYTMVVNILECTNMENILLDSHYSYPPANMITFKKEVGVQKIVFNTKDSFEQVGTSIKIATYGKDTTNKLKISKHMLLLEGDWTDKEIPPYFEGMKSVGECEDNKIEILSQNKNLIDLNRFKASTDKGTVSIDGDVITFNYKGSYPTLRHTFTQKEINLLKGKTFKFGHSGITDTVENNSLNIRFVAVIDGVNKYYPFPYATNYTSIVTLPNNIQSLEFSVLPNNTNNSSIQGTFTISNMQLVFADTENTNYIKHLSNKKEILLNEPLRGLPNGIKDRKVKIGGKWYIERNNGELLFNGEESWSLNQDMGDIIQFTRHAGRFGGVQSSVLSDKFITLGGHVAKEGVWIYNNNTMVIHILKTRLATQDLNGFKQWLSNNPTKVVYELATPIYEPLEIEPTLNTYNDITHISNNSIIPCNMKIKNSGYNAIIKPSTLYTVALDTSKSGTVGMNLGGAKGTTTNNVLKLTTPATLADDSLRLYGKGIKGSKVRLLEGDKTNWIPSFFEGMQSSFEDKVQEDGTYKMEILSNNENLFSVDDTKLLDKSSAHDIITNSTGYKLISKTDHRGWVYSNFKLPNILKPNTKYTFSCNITKSNSDSKVALRLYRFSDSMDLGLLLKTGSVTFTTPSTNVESIRLLTYTSIDDVPINQDDYVIFENIQISEITSDYITKEYNKIQFSSIEPLRSVGDIKDRFVFKDSKLMIERNCRQAEGAELVYARVHQPAYTDRFAIQASLNDCVKDHAKEGTIKCNKLPHKYNGFDVNYDCISSHKSNNGVYINLNKNMWGYNGSNGREILERYIRENNIILTVQKTEPIYEEIPFELQKIILEGYENGTLFIDTIIPPTVSTTYAGETPLNKSVRLNKTEVLNNTNDINDNIVPYLMDMDYRVVCLQLQSENTNNGISMARLFGGTYEMLQRDILSKRYSIDEYRYRLDVYLSANKITEDEYNKLGDMLNE